MTRGNINIGDIIVWKGYHDLSPIKKSIVIDTKIEKGIIYCKIKRFGGFRWISQNYISYVLTPNKMNETNKL